MTAPAPLKLSNIQTLRGLAALLVVFTHIPSMEIKHGGDSILPDFTRLGISGVDLFFVISGFIMVYVTWHAKHALKNTLSFWFARLSRIFPIYWLIALAVLLAWTVKPGIISFDPEQTSIIKSLLLWPDQTLPMLKVAWTLIHELYFYLVFGLLLLLPRKLLVPGLAVWMVFVILGNRIGWSELSPETALIFHPLTAEFFMGAIAGWVFIKTKGAAGAPALIIGLTLWCVGFYYLATAFPGTFYPSNWERVLYFGIPGALIVYGLAGIERQGFSLPVWSATFGDWSYSLYLSHILTLSVLGYIWRPFAIEGPLDNIVAIIILLAGSTAVSALLWYVFERPVLTLFRRLRARVFPND
ncbi:MAG: acyltransferase family protein [Alphaproteobacteria bacterium]